MRNDYLNKIDNVNKLILSYQGSNKKYIIDGFDTDIKLLSTYLKKTLKPDRYYIQNKLIYLLKKLQASENRYYNTFLFTQNFRKRHSSLQVKINDVKNMLDKFLSEEKELPKNVRLNI